MGLLSHPHGPVSLARLGAGSGPLKLSGLAQTRGGVVRRDRRDEAFPLLRALIRGDGCEHDRENDVGFVGCARGVHGLAYEVAAAAQAAQGPGL